MTRQPLEEYLGDGVYASYDGYYLWLDLRAQPDHNLHDPMNRIGLEPPVLANLLSFIDRIRELQEASK